MICYSLSPSWHNSTSPFSHSFIGIPVFLQILLEGHVGMNWFHLYSKKRVWPLVPHPPMHPYSAWSSKWSLYCSQCTASAGVFTFEILYPIAFIKPGTKQLSSCIYYQYVIITWFAQIFCSSSNITSFYRGSHIKVKSQGPEISLSCMFTLDGGIQPNAGLWSLPGHTSAPVALLCAITGEKSKIFVSYPVLLTFFLYRSSRSRLWESGRELGKAPQQNWTQLSQAFFKGLALPIHISLEKTLSAKDRKFWFL